MRKYANNKGADQPAHPRSLISVFIVRYLDSIIHILAKSKNFKTLPSLCGCADRFQSTLVANPEDRFSSSLYCVRQQKRLWRYYAVAQASSSLRWLPMHYGPFSHGLTQMRCVSMTIFIVTSQTRMQEGDGDAFATH